MLPFSFKFKFNFESVNKKENVFKDYLNDWKESLEEKKVTISPVIFIIIIGLITTPFFNLDLLKFTIMGLLLFSGVNIGFAYSRITTLAGQINKY